MHSLVELNRTDFYKGRTAIYVVLHYIISYTNIRLLAVYFYTIKF